MQISISGQHIDITPALRTKVTEKLAKVVEHCDQITSLGVVLHVENDTHMAEASLHAKGMTLHATGQKDNMYAAIDDMASKLDRQVIKHKQKQSNHHQAEGGLAHNL